MTPRQLAALAVKAAGVPTSSPTFPILVDKVADSINAERAAMAVEISATKLGWYDSGDAIAALEHLFSTLKRNWATEATQKKR
jgi:hypothetical protein